MIGLISGNMLKEFNKRNHWSIFCSLHYSKAMFGKGVKCDESCFHLSSFKKKKLGFYSYLGGKNSTAVKTDYITF